MQVHIWNRTQVLSQIDCNKAQKVKKKRQRRIRNIQIFHPVNPIVRSTRVPKENKSTKKFTAHDIQQ